METTEKILGQAANSQRTLRDLQSFVELDGEPQQKLFEAGIASPSIRKQEAKFAPFETAITEKNYQKFDRLIKGLDLSDYQPTEITVLIDLCLSLDMIAAAFDLAAKARELYPSHIKIESAYKALSPPKFIGTRPPQAAGLKKSQAWFKENASHYKGKWVAVNNGNLLAEADSLKELKNVIDENDMNPSTVIEKIF
jgi:hypothetical protein